MITSPLGRDHLSPETFHRCPTCELGRMLGSMGSFTWRRKMQNTDSITAQFSREGLENSVMEMRTLKGEPGKDRRS